MTKVYLAGGLGNQLFQFSAAKLVAKEGKVELIYGHFPSRKLDNSKEIFSDLSFSDVSVSERDARNWLLRKALNYALRRSAITTKTGFDKRLLSIGISILTFFVIGRMERYFVNNGLGWDERLLDEEPNVVLIGYFQSYVVGRAGRDILKMLLNDVQIPQKNLQNPDYIMIHIRLTDYLSADSLSHLDDQYYLSALSELQQEVCTEYMIFTDGTQKELNTNFRFADISRVVDTTSLSAWQVLKLMSKYDAFIIANSSFSWWAASLKVNNLAKVVAPKHWFTENSPKGIHDPGWILI